MTTPPKSKPIKAFFYEKMKRKAEFKVQLIQVDMPAPDLLSIAFVGKKNTVALDMDEAKAKKLHEMFSMYLAKVQSMRDEAQADVRVPHTSEGGVRMYFPDDLSGAQLVGEDGSMTPVDDEMINSIAKDFVQKLGNRAKPKAKKPH